VSSSGLMIRTRIGSKPRMLDLRLVGQWPDAHGGLGRAVPLEQLA
jgi:hypothetical protein